MRLLKLITAFSLLFIFTQCSSPAKKQEKIAGTKVPTEWIERVRNDSRRNTMLLLKQFEGFIAPDTLDGTTEKPHYTGILNDQPPGVLMPKFVNLDDDPAEELIGLFGYYHRDYPTLAVFKLIGNSWYMLYHESFYDFYSAAELKYANSFSPNKLFYINCLYNRGSGIYLDTYRFFKLINNKVHPCLEITKEAHIYGWGLRLNQQDSTSFQIDSNKSDRISATYHYDFFPGYEYDTPEAEQIQMSFAKGAKTVSYKWNKRNFRYEPELSRKPGDMTQAQIANLSKFGEDSLFITAFADEIQQNLDTIRSKEKNCLMRYLAFAKSKKNATGATSGVEETQQTGSTKFYRPKKQ